MEASSSCLCGAQMPLDCRVCVGTSPGWFGTVNPAPTGLILEMDVSKNLSGRMGTLAHNLRQWIAALIATQLFSKNIREDNRGWDMSENSDRMPFPATEPNASEKWGDPPLWCPWNFRIRSIRAITPGYSTAAIR